jgi:2-polyprenyl-3-methyl-5-hydroxy-6-metoxy-1,4-benzoquinol methylase
MVPFWHIDGTNASDYGTERRQTWHQPVPFEAKALVRLIRRVLAWVVTGQSRRRSAAIASTLLNVDQHEHRETGSVSAAQAAEWDARYSEGEGARWSGRPNGRLVAEVASLTPGRALDVGCGEGADAIWLARRGWTVTAIDVSDVALIRAQEAAELAGAVVEWVRGDALQTPFPAGSFDLVSMQYPALPKAAGEAPMRALLGTVRLGGLLLAVYHDLNDEHREHIKSQGIDPADYVDAGDLARLLEDEFTIELQAVEPRIDPPPDHRHIADVVLRARRR